MEPVFELLGGSGEELDGFKDGGLGCFFEEWEEGLRGLIDDNDIMDGVLFLKEGVDMIGESKSKDDEAILWVGLDSFGDFLSFFERVIRAMEVSVLEFEDRELIFGIFE